MKALVYTRYGPPDVLQLKDIERPVAVNNEIVIKIHATTVNRTDCATIRGIPFFARMITGLFRPNKQIPGTEFAGEVVELGAEVSTFNLGDRVFGFDDEGAESHAEYTCVAADKVVTMPGNVTYAEAAASSEGAHYALNFINKINLESGQRVLVNGATGAIGSSAVQLLKYFETEITAVCATEHIELVTSLGASRVIDYKEEDFTADTQKFDYVFDAVGKSSFFECRKLLNSGGVYISSDLGYLSQNLVLPLITPAIKPFIEHKITKFPTPSNIGATLLLVQSLIEQGKFKTVIDRQYPLKNIVEAYKYVETGQKVGNVIITVWPASQSR